MPDDDQTPLDPEPDPTEGDEEPEAEDTAEADDQPGSDQEDPLEAAQRLIAQQAQELALFRGKAAEPTDDDAGSETAPSDDFVERATQDSWTLAETLHGKAAMDAYRAAYALYEKAQTPADFVTAFEAYHQIRSGKAPAPEGDKGKGKTRAEATTPRVDANRSDPGSDLADAEKQLTEARKSGSLDQFAAAAAARLGFGPARR